MAHAKWMGAAVALFGASLRANPAAPGPPAPTARPNQSISIEESSPLDSPGADSGPAPTVNSSDPAMASTVPNRQRPPIFLGKKKSADESHRFAGESDRPWYGTGIGALAIVLGLIVVLFLVLRRWTPSLRTGGSGVVQIVGRTVLAPRQSLVLVQLGRRLVLIGVSAERIQPVCEITDNEEAAAILAESRRIRGDFSSWLDREAAEFAREGAQDGAGGETVSGRSKPLGHLLQKLRSSKV